MQRRWANISLGITLILLMIALVVHHAVWAQYLLAMSMAGLAGGIADWYAVTALFRHPLGLKWLPHTSIISANRDRIIEAIATLVERELLSVTFIEKNIARLKVGPKIVEFLRMEPPRPVLEFIENTTLEWLSLIPQDRVSAWLRQVAHQKGQDVSLSDLLVRLIKWLIQSDRDRDLFQFLARHAVDALNTVEFTDEMENRLKSLIENYTKTTTQKFVLSLLESLGTVDYKELAVAVKMHLIRWLESDKAMEQFELVLVRMMMSLRDDATVRSQVEKTKDDALSRLPWEQLLKTLMTQIEAYIQSGSGSMQLDRLRIYLADLMEQNPEHQDRVESLIKRISIVGVRNYHPIIGRLVRENLAQMNEREWIDKLEWYVGRDLQWIRVNGAIVGGLVGLLLEVVMHL